MSRSGTKSDRLFDLLFKILNARAPIPLSEFNDSKWGDSRTFLRLHQKLNEDWQRYRGCPLFEFVDASGKPASRGERFIRLNDTAILHDIEQNEVRKIFSLSAVLELGRLVKGTLVEDEYKPILKSLTKDLKGPSKKILQQVDRKFYFFGKGMKDYSSSPIRDILDEVYSALLYEWLVELTWQRENAVKTQKFKVLSLVMFNGGLYLATLPEISNDLKDLRIWKLETFTVAKALRGKKFQYPANYDPRDVFRGSFGLMIGPVEEEVTVELLFSEDPYVQQYIRERKWTGNERYKVEKDGRLRMTFEVRNLYEVKSFILSFGAEVEVLQPKLLRKEVHDILRESLKNYKIKVNQPD